MIVVAIVGILASIAYPNYTRYVQKSKRTDAMVALMQAAQQQEKYFSQNLKYAHDEETLYGLADGTAVESENDLYTITVSGTKSGGGVCTNADAANSCITYTVKAVAKSGESQTHDQTCREFTVTNTGVKDSGSWSGSAVVDNADGVCW